MLHTALAAVLVLALVADASAHRTDEYLQAARIGIEPDFVDIYLELTPGTAFAESVISVIDRDLDGRVSADEERAYARWVVGDLTIRLDGKPLALQSISSDFPGQGQFLRGEGSFRVHAVARPGVVSSGAHEILFSNGGHGTPAVYLANAVVPESPRVRILGQRRNIDQSELQIDYSLNRQSAASVVGPILASLTATMLTVIFVRRRVS